MLQAKKQALHIDVEDGVEIGLGIFDQVGIDVGAGAIGGEIDLTKACRGLFDRADHIRLAREVDRDDNAIAANVSQEIERLLPLRRARRPTTATEVPARANATAAARPIPEVPPVTKAVLPLKESMKCSLFGLERFQIPQNPKALQICFIAFLDANRHPFRLKML
jgi:hypothetical protein